MRSRGRWVWAAAVLATLLVAALALDACAAATSCVRSPVHVGGRRFTLKVAQTLRCRQRALASIATTCPVASRYVPNVHEFGACFPVASCCVSLRPIQVAGVATISGASTTLSAAYCSAVVLFAPATASRTRNAIDSHDKDLLATALNRCVRLCRSASSCLLASGATSAFT